MRNIIYENKNEYEFIRFGGLSPVNQKISYNSDTYHSAPARKGIYVFPYDMIEWFLMGSQEYSGDKYEYVKDGIIMNGKTGYPKFNAETGQIYVPA